MSSTTDVSIHTDSKGLHIVTDSEGRANKPVFKNLELVFDVNEFNGSYVMVLNMDSDTSLFVHRLQSNIRAQDVPIEDIIKTHGDKNQIKIKLPYHTKSSPYGEKYQPKFCMFKDDELVNLVNIKQVTPYLKRGAKLHVKCKMDKIFKYNGKFWPTLFAQELKILPDNC